MTNAELLITTCVNTMVQLLMTDYHVTYSWAMKTVLASHTYSLLLSNSALREESPLYVYQYLVKELKDSRVVVEE